MLTYAYGVIAWEVWTGYRARGNGKEERWVKYRKQILGVLCLDYVCRTQPAADLQTGQD